MPSQDELDQIIKEELKKMLMQMVNEGYATPEFVQDKSAQFLMKELVRTRVHIEIIKQTLIKFIRQS